jgi:hypothetical protein
MEPRKGCKTMANRTYEHVDDFIDAPCYDTTEVEAYAAWMLNHYRFPANLKFKFNKFMKSHKLFATYKDQVYLVTGASRMGDVWLATDFNREIGYDLRVDINDIQSWGNNPDSSYVNLSCQSIQT